MYHLHTFDDVHRNDPVLQWIRENQGQVESPMYLYSMKTLAEAAGKYKSLFPENTCGFYSLKSNPQMELVKRFARVGIGAEVVSPGEWEVARRSGSENMLVGGISRSEAFFARIIEHEPRALIIDSTSEWQRLQAVARADKPVSLLLRVNPGVSFGGMNMAGGTQFGLEPEQAMTIAKEAAHMAGIDFKGLHIYFGGQRLKLNPVLKALDEIEKVMVPFYEAGLLKIVDLGLGLGVPYVGRDKELDMEEMRTALHQKWQTSPWKDIQIWFEAGRALISQAGYFVSRVVERKTLHGKTFIFLDGGISIHNPGIGVGRFFRDNPRFCYIAQAAEHHTEEVEIVGNLCLSADQLGSNVSTPHLVEGDLVIVPNAGAYCATTGMWGFNSQGMFKESILEEDGSLTSLEPQYQQLTWGS